ncbi:MAG TPA: uroporphyrinogen decarboxylase [Kiritimatiellia bacterium]|nr:uroporphyrinogen decarboxylase [Kiritimatiellia bacterium]HMO97539.1 uroporphyrinogen decarboxylase [Kiritimatiellia bacterium]HMP97023.1 uroporphyrinogen decarboxylase [Kiritimatiellia bacterium]
MNDRFLQACRLRPVDRVPVWLMRQAGRYMPEYRAIREKHALLDMIRDPAIAAEVTLQPVRAFGVDAAIIFSDILPLLEGFGRKLTFVSGRGPVIENPLRPEDVAGCPRTADPSATSFTLDAIRLVRRELEGKIPLIGFCGAPFTLACYAIEGGSSRDFDAARRFMVFHPAAWHAWMERLAGAAADYLIAQIDAGAQAVQLFDSWVGLLGPDDYREFVLPHTREVFRAVREKHPDVPAIHFATGTSGLLRELREAGGSVIGVDWRIDIDRAWELIGHDRAVQGNLDPAVLLADRDLLTRRALAILERAGRRPGFIFNLGHGVLKQTDPEQVAYLVRLVQQFRPGESGERQGA